jgi:hypothetical protein
VLVQRDRQQGRDSGRADGEPSALTQPPHAHADQRSGRDIHERQPGTERRKAIVDAQQQSPDEIHGWRLRGSKIPVRQKAVQKLASTFRKTPSEKSQ